MKKTVILTDSIVIDGHVVSLLFASESNESVVSGVKNILCSVYEKPHNLQQSPKINEGGVENDEAV